VTQPLHFEEPPQINRRHIIPDDVVKLLTGNPGEWMVVRDNAPTANAAYATAHQIRHGRLIAFRPPGAFEARGRTVEGTFRVYARYIGPDGDHL
jgi:hypothetical protein